jgi:hypothetical protein
MGEVNPTVTGEATKKSIHKGQFSNTCQQNSQFPEQDNSSLPNRQVGLMLCNMIDYRWFNHDNYYSMTCSMPVKRRRLDRATITHHWQPVYMSTRSKQKGPDAPRQKAPEAYWTPADEAALVSFLSDEGAVEGASYKPQVWTRAAAKMKNPPDRGAPKTAAACKGKWGRVCILHTSHVANIINLHRSNITTPM